MSTKQQIKMQVIAPFWGYSTGDDPTTDSTTPGLVRKVGVKTPEKHVRKFVVSFISTTGCSTS